MDHTIKTGRFILRPFKPEDALTLSVRINTASIEKYTTIELPWSIDFAAWWISFISEEATKRPISEIHWVIEVDGEFAGALGIINIDVHKGEIGYWLDEKYKGQGIMTEAVKRVTEYGFKKMPLKRIFAPVLPYNKGSMRVLEKNGYELEGTFKKHFNKKGKLWDALIYAKTSD